MSHKKYRAILSLVISYEIYFVPCDISEILVQCNFSYLKSFNHSIQTKVARLLVLVYFFFDTKYCQKFQFNDFYLVLF